MSCKRCLSYLTKCSFGILMFCVLATFIIYLVGLVFPWSELKITPNTEYTASVFSYRGCYSGKDCYSHKWSTDDPVGCMTTEVLYPIGTLASIAMIIFYVIWTCTLTDADPGKENRTRIIISIILLFCLIIVMTAIISWVTQCHPAWVSEIEAIEQGTLIESNILKTVEMIGIITGFWILVALLHLAFGQELYKWYKKHMSMTINELEME